ncbi:Carboxypeptidase [Meloidogyne graminicola]|uniref:Carboxypeptidase n=1 Tax=Meloidogyne graminicola TaxID=189291 RepID=A0A8S9ZJR1_9BILA|nr:Carboxypeptidase [Meloidogyne graminicola]
MFLINNNLILKIFNLYFLFISFFEKINSQTSDMDKIGDLLPGIQNSYLYVSNNYMLHYWFVTSQTKSNKLIFWFNGGPGCSSLDGLLSEIGPYLINSDGKTLRKNNYSWNKYSSIVFIESPAGVGYSYSINGNITTNDDNTAINNYEAIKQFLQIHSNYQNHNIYLMGESYAGVYLPLLASKIIDGQKKFKINFKGMAIGNAPIFAYSHGIINEKFWEVFSNHCCNGCVDNCNIYNFDEKKDSKCIDESNKIFSALWGGKFNPYDLYRKCENTSNKNNNKINKYPMLINLLFSKNKKINLLFKNKKINNKLIYSTGSPCIDDSAINNYMRQPSVKLSLHIPQNQKFNWEVCNLKLNSIYNTQYEDMTLIIKKVLNSNISTLLYYGDTDSVCNFFIGQKFASQLGYQLKNPSHPWFLNGQVGGFVTEYFGNLTYLTVKGIGHLVPKWAPSQAEYIIKQFLMGEKI